MPAIGRAHTFEGLGRGLGEFSRLLFGLQERREAEELADQQRTEERDYRNRLLGLRERQATRADEAAELERARYQQGLAAQGMVQPEYREVPRVPSFSESLDVGVPRLGLAAGTTPPGPFEERMRTEVLGEAPSFETPEFVLAEGGYDPSRDVGLQRTLALEQAQAALEPATEEAVNWVLTTDEQGRRVQVHPRTGQVRRLGISDPSFAGGEGGGTVQERQNRQLAQAATTANNAFDKIDEQLAGAQGIPATIAARGGAITGTAARFMTGPKAQAAGTLALNFVNPVVRYLSGAQMNVNEEHRYYRSLIPLPGDEPTQVRLKALMRRSLINAMNSGELPAGQPGPNGEPDTANVDRVLNTFMAELLANNVPAVGGAQQDAGPSGLVDEVRDTVQGLVEGVDNQLAADIDAELQAGKSVEQIISEMQAVGVPPAIIQQARSYLGGR